MPAFMPQSLKLFPLDPTSTTLVEQLAQFNAFVHKTQLPGGFWTADLTISLDQAKFLVWYLDRFLHRLLMQEDGGKVIWHGRLEDIDLADRWAARLKFVGYHSAFDDLTAGDESGNGVAIVKELRDNVNTVNANTLSTSNEFILASTVTLNLSHLSDDISKWDQLTNPTSGLLRFGDTSDNKIDLAVWDDRIVHYVTRGSPTVTWQAFITDGSVTQMPVGLSWKDIANSVAVRHSGGLVTATTDAASIAKWNERQVIVGSTSIGSSGSADELQTNTLAQRKDIQQRMQNLEIVRVFDTRGVEFPICRVRAGEVIRIPDFIPLSSDLDVTTINSLTTYFIEETTCDHTRGVLTIRPDNESLSLVQRLRGVTV